MFSSYFLDASVAPQIDVLQLRWPEEAFGFGILVGVRYRSRADLRACFYRSACSSYPEHDLAAGMSRLDALVCPGGFLQSQDLLQAYGELAVVEQAC